MRFLAAFAAVVILGLSAGCGNDNATGDKGYVEGDGAIRTIAVAKRQPVEAITGKALDGSPLSVRDLGGGKPTVVNVWASWCSPCRKESATLVKAHDELGDSAAFVGLNIRDAGTAQGEAFERRFGISWPSLYDPSARSLLAFPVKVPPSAIPSTFVLDAKGRVAVVILGPVPGADTLADLVRAAA